jgi:mannose-6-phosphate isomerase-like protein (cupin superfamily)
MGYELIDTADIDPLSDRAVTCVEISDHFVPPPDDDGDGAPTPTAGRGPTNVGLRRYHVEPGQSLGGTDRMHSHEEQEEVFYVFAGTLSVETPDDRYDVGPGQVLVVEPGSPQRAHVPAEATDPCDVLAIGAPSYSKIGRNDAKMYSE